MATYNVFEHEILGTKVIKTGISYGALLSTFIAPQIWMAYRKLWTPFWVYNIFYLWYIFYLERLAPILLTPWENAIPPLSVNLVAIISIILLVSPAMYGNDWRAESLYNLNYKRVDTIEAGSYADATKIALFNKENNKRKIKAYDSNLYPLSDYIGMGSGIWIIILVVINIFK